MREDNDMLEDTTMVVNEDMPTVTMVTIITMMQEKVIDMIEVIEAMYVRDTMAMSAVMDTRNVTTFIPMTTVKKEEGIEKDMTTVM